MKNLDEKKTQKKDSFTDWTATSHEGDLEANVKIFS